MRTITVKYEGTCAKCGNVLEVGSQANYEKTTGIFCIGCTPTDPEEIRKHRTEKVESKARKYDAWAKKREDKAHATLNHNSRYTNDLAFCTQPHIPGRDRIIAQNGKAYENILAANEMREKSASLRGSVRVKGDAQKYWDSRADAVRTWIKPGAIADWMGRNFEIVKVNRKTAKLKSGWEGGPDFNVELHLLAKPR